MARRGAAKTESQLIRSVFKSLHAPKCLPDPWALNSCMHTFPETNAGCTNAPTRDSSYLDMGFETLDVNLCELKL